MRHFIITVIVMLLITLLLQIDDELSEQSRLWITELEQKKESNAYHYLLGFSATPDQNPLTLGLKIHEQIQSAEQSFFAGQEYQYTEVQQNKLELPDGDWNCNFEDRDCFITLMQSLQTLDSVFLDNTVLINRFEEFLSFDDFHIQTNPLLDAPLPPYHYLSRAHRLRLLQLTKDIIADPDQVSILQQHIINIQSIQRAANTLIAKMIFSKYLSDTIDVLWYLKQSEGFEKLPTIRISNPIETGLAKAIKYEFGFLYNLFQNMDKHKDLLEETDKLPGWSIRLLFKPNMTSNLAQQRYQQVIDNMGLSPEEFSELMQASTPSRSSISLRNPIGLLLMNISEPEFNRYIARIHNLNRKILLYQQTEISADGTLEYEKKSDITLQNKKLCYKNIYNVSQQHESCVHLN